ncbi:hypothetical protein [Leifsonia sp. AG29]|uniref:hypothetical protein n=1 Tax=Leifsonia sp. AG29 TaxID=2598860 RepID=UPI00131ED0C3|nr:hypothetical protein [Leifsonia sp. AG29]
MVGAGVLAVGGPAVNVAVRTSLGLVNETGSAGIDQLVADPLAYARGIFLTGTYPVTTWIVYALIGILLGRGVLAAIQAGTLHRFAVRSLVVGAAAAMSAHVLSTAAYFAFARNDLLSDLLSRVDPEQLAPMKDRIDEFLLGTGYGAPTGWAALALDVPHTGTVLDIARGVGVATAIIGACLLLPLRTPAPILLRPVLAAGSAPLTSYAAHLLLLALTSGVWMIEGLPLPRFTGWTAFLANVGLLLALGAALALVGRRGPLETPLGRLAAIPAEWARRNGSSHPTNSRGAA